SLPTPVPLHDALPICCHLEGMAAWSPRRNQGHRTRGRLWCQPIISEHLRRNIRCAFCELPTERFLQQFLWEFLESHPLARGQVRSEEHTSELQSRGHL